MTFCIGIQVRQGIVALADSRIVVGSTQSSKRKLASLPHPAGSLFTMTSGLRSIRDKTLTYLGEQIDADPGRYRRVYQVANQFGEQLRRVRQEDNAALQQAGLAFNSHAIIGGQLADDTTPRLYYVYPEGNWIETNPDLPYFMIGRTSYGKPILDRLLHYETPIQQALNLALLAFDATRTSVTDVDGPVDVALIQAGQFGLQSWRFSDSDLAPATDWWQSTLQNALHQMPTQWAQCLFSVSSPPTESSQNAHH